MSGFLGAFSLKCPGQAACTYRHSERVKKSLSNGSPVNEDPIL